MHNDKFGDKIISPSHRADSASQFDQPTPKSASRALTGSNWERKWSVMMGMHLHNGCAPNGWFQAHPSTFWLLYCTVK